MNDTPPEIQPRPAGSIDAGPVLAACHLILCHHHSYLHHARTTYDARATTFHLDQLARAAGLLRGHLARQGLSRGHILTGPFGTTGDLSDGLGEARRASRWLADRIRTNEAGEHFVVAEQLAEAVTMADKAAYLLARHLAYSAVV